MKIFSVRGTPCLAEIPRDADMICLVLHGFGSSKRSPTAERLFGRFPALGIGVLSFDFPGHGESVDGAPELRMDACLDAVAAAEGWARENYPEAETVYFASSFGAYTALLYLSERPHAGRRAFFRSAAVCMPALMRVNARERERVLARDGFVTMGTEYGYARPLRLTAGFFEDLERGDVFSLWRPGEAELRMIHGESDETVPLSEARRFAEKFRVPLTVFPGGDHRLSVPGAPEETLRLAEEFFLKTDSNA